MICTDAKCTVCGGPTKVAKSTGRIFKYCSDQCRSRARSIGTWAQPSLCEECGESFTPSRRGVLFCGEVCRCNRMRRLRKESQLPRYCPCGTRVFKPSQLYCCDECRPHRSKKIRPARAVRCVVCSGEFLTKTVSKYCSEVCRSSVKYKSRQPLGEVESVCSHCGVVFKGRKNKSYCSGLCRRRAGKRRSMKKSSGHRERCQIYHRRYQPINPIKIFERDNWICMICFAPIDRDTVAPDPLAASLDHRIPLSKGGHHEWNNVRCAHFGCNSIKSDKLDEDIQWPEVGHQSRQTS